MAENAVAASAADIENQLNIVIDGGFPDEKLYSDDGEMEVDKDNGGGASQKVDNTEVCIIIQHLIPSKAIY